MAWRCAECGERYEDDNPPCTACGHHSFVEADEDGDDQNRALVWACTECGREHQKNSPPCSRCGHVYLEKRRPDYSDLEAPGSSSYLDALEPKYVVGYAVAIGVIVLIGLSVTGVLALPMFGGQPSLPDAPGAAASYENVSLSAVEEAYVEELNGWRAEAGVAPLSVGSNLDDAATAYNRKRATARDADGTTTDLGRLLDRYNTNCDRQVGVAPQTARAAVAFDGSDGAVDASTVAHRLQLRPDAGRSALLADRYSKIGVDVHVAPTDRVYVTVLVC